MFYNMDSPRRFLRFAAVVFFLGLLAAAAVGLAAKKVTAPTPGFGPVAPPQVTEQTGPALGALERLDSLLGAAGAKLPANAVWADRVIYAPNDPSAQILVVSEVLNKSPAGTQLEVTLIDANGELLGVQNLVTKEDPAYLVTAKMNTNRLPAGAYTLAGRVIPPDGAPATNLVSGTFSVDKTLRPVAGFPIGGVPLVVPPVPTTGSTVAPLSFGAPLPYGAILPGDALEVWEDGKPVLTQSRPLALWGPDTNNTVRWMGISFVARYVDGKAKSYVLKKSSSEFPSPLSLVEDGPVIRLDTGAIRFQISKKSFRGAEQVAVKDAAGWSQLASAATGGAYVVDEQGTRYEAAADPNPEVKIDETGPVRAAVSIRGWYVNPAKPEEKFCRFQIRIYAYAGLARIDGFQRTIITYDTRQKKLADVGFAMPAVASAEAAGQWFTGIDGQTREGAVAEGKEVFFAQASPDAVWLNDIAGESVGKRSDGWLAVRSGRVTASGYLRDVWEKYPKEISLAGGQLTFHSWPKHGRRIVSPEEEISRENIHRTLFAHQGPLLDLQLPEAYFNQLQ